ncbi:DNA-directed RNA polymerase III subunit RPC9 isoform X1 [Cherax quadricarinatus]|uniref:DNA-directed RNA polymerase III subunit RPC9 isoform X1 n=1 Tax=Cherax quadricarinatus TaxID=27406 RepID=UPI00387E8628
MEVVNSKGAVLSNCEVYSLLQDLCQQGAKGRRNLAKTQTHLANIAYDTLKYLEKTPCRNQNPEIIQRFLQSVKDFKLTKAEKLQLINLRPTTPVEMQLMVTWHQPPPLGGGEYRLLCISCAGNKFFAASLTDTRISLLKVPILVVER